MKSAAKFALGFTIGVFVGSSKVTQVIWGIIAGTLVAHEILSHLSRIR